MCVCVCVPILLNIYTELKKKKKDDAASVTADAKKKITGV